ncbi:MAG TPA: hypothetical protein VFU02_16590 [Polyangiaceae bacterium]|nr:hypothetical protein [Polyangiaceae bacterium]
MHTALAVLVKLLAALTALGAVLAFRKSRRAGTGLLPAAFGYRQVLVDSLYYPAALAAAAASMALWVTSDGWGSLKLALLVGGGLGVVLWPFYFLTRLLFAKIAFAAMDSHRAFAEHRGLSFEVSGPQYRDGSEPSTRPATAAVHLDGEGWLALVTVTSGSVGERGLAQKTRLELPVRADVREPQIWNLKPIGGLLGRALSEHSEALARLGPRLSYVRLHEGRLVLLGAPNRSREQVAEFVSFGEGLARSIDELYLASQS